MSAQILTVKMENIGNLFKAIAADQKLYLPLEQAGQVQFLPYDPADDSQKVRLDVLNTVRSAKDLFFPQSENMVAFKKQGKKIDIIENREKVEAFTVFGVRACDARSFDILDRVFLSEPVDVSYAERRARGTVVTLACNEPEETCFCETFGIDAAKPDGDITTWIADGLLWWQANTNKGVKLTDKLLSVDAGLFVDSTGEAKALEEQQEKIREIISQLPLHGLSLEYFHKEELKTIFNSPKWQELSEACIGCGTCTFVCPTCQCYDIRDYDTGNGVQRYRCWDSCMYSDFVMMAHGNPRTSQVERFRQRFMHKLVYYPANNEGIFSCVGCGRCLAKCPSSMNIVKVAKTIGGEANV
ncbi:MAG: 4Fe-4S dicluster domain-containing protein [Eubacteriales bacterium]|nr:4Fe-4S dicluster domain-containing protein [Eubacteriales bacterium]